MAAHLEAGDCTPGSLPPLAAAASAGRAAQVPAAALIRQRRSCLALDGQTALDARRFYACSTPAAAARTCRRGTCCPGRPLVHAAVFVHRVSGLDRACTCSSATGRSTKRCGPPAGRRSSGSGLPAARSTCAFYLLTEGDFRDTAPTVSCHQEIAADGAFSLGMIAEFGDTIARPRGVVVSPAVLGGGRAGPGAVPGGGGRRACAAPASAATSTTPFTSCWG